MAPGRQLKLRAPSAAHGLQYYLLYGSGQLRIPEHYVYNLLLRDGMETNQAMV